MLVKFKRDYVIDLNEGCSFTFRRGYSYPCVELGLKLKISNIDNSISIYFDADDRKKYLEE